ncbi:hypothetical protein [Streptomyces sp. NRRL B-3648]|uniref:hypothetical protein n=1 Tax=Streptomyces sp. NRRL B-3648 TaxID=1519493 RepID=UPI0006C1CAD9|nr:hypothetical protein [Streptomyces sp. NRRL B-3648]KOV90254.1 hypothetical protein ADL04_36585 [Streptomyces sp. NRRL B-3648]
MALNSGPKPTAVAAHLTDDASFFPSWLHGKAVTPVPVGGWMDAALARRVTAGCRAVGASHIFRADLKTGRRGVDTIRLPLGTEGAQGRPPSLWWTPDGQGAVLFPESGYALVAGTAPFMTAAVGEGVDTARARFTRYARTLDVRQPSLTVVAAAYPPIRRAWSRPAEVDPNSSVARQLKVLDAFTQGSCLAPDFARGWWEARRAAQANGERIQGALEDLFDEVFMILEDYSVDPDLAEPRDLSDAELRAAVQEVWAVFRRKST